MSSDAARNALPLTIVGSHYLRSAAAETLPRPAVPEVADEELLIQLKKRDCEALALLFDRYSRLILTIGFRILKDYAEAEDLLQDVFIHLYEKCKGFDADKGSARTWIVQVAYCRAFDRRAYLTRRKFYAGTSLAEYANTLKDEGNLDDQVTARVTGEQLRGAFDRLNEKQRLTLEMFFFDGYTFREIAQRMGETLENTRHHYYRGIQRLNKAAGNGRAMGKREIIEP